MTYEQIEKEFDGIEWKHWHSKSSSFERLPDSTKTEIKSFLKRSFIKYLQKNIEFIDDRVREEIKLETVEMCDVYLGKLYAYDEIKKSLQAQIKELETCK